VSEGRFAAPKKEQKNEDFPLTVHADGVVLGVDEKKNFGNHKPSTLKK
jgi:hypothetical protein